MKCYIQILFLLMIIAVYWIDEVKCKPRKHSRKNINLEKTRLPIKHVSFVLEKITPFGKYEFKHVINKRQAELSEVPIVPREIPVSESSLDDITEKKEILQSNLEPTVIITSIVKPIDNVKSLPLSSPFDSRLLITPPENIHEIVGTPVNEVIAENEPPNTVLQVVAPVENIIPKPAEILPPPESPIEPNVLINTIVENTVPPLVRIPIYRNPSFPFVNPVFGNVGKSFLYTDITQIPLNVAPYAAPVVVPIPEVILSPPPPPPVPPPPVIKVDPPPIKQETPNFLVKGSRLVLYVGSMMLQMLSRFVDGGFNFNQIPIPIIPGMQ